MKSCRPKLDAMNSMAQQASPKLKTHSEYRRPQFSTNRMGSPSTPGRPVTGSTYRAGGGSPREADNHRYAATPTLRRVKRVSAGIAASHPVTAEVGLRVLQDGGTAADAAVA